MPARTREKTTKWGVWELSIFSRAIVCNVFLIAKVWYVYQVLACARVNVQKLHLVFAVLFCGSGWERVRLDNLFHRVSKGGLSLSHVFVKPVVSRFMFLWDQTTPFIRAIIQTRLSEEMPSFVVSSSRRKQDKIGSYLREVIEAYHFLSVRFSLQNLSCVNRKRLTRNIIETVFPVPIYRSLFLAGPGHDVISHVKKKVNSTVYKDFFSLNCTRVHFP